MLELTINGRRQPVRASPDTPLLWVLRDEFGLLGTKFGCGAGLCGACTVHIDGEKAFACVTPVASIAGRSVTTIEALVEDSDHPLVQAWIAEQVPQCGYCQAGQMMAAAVLLKHNSTPDDQAIDQAMVGNLCRCGAYLRIRRAIKAATKIVAAGG